MSWRCEKVHERQLRPARSEEEYLLHQAALEWSLADCIVIQSAEDIQSKASWHDRLEPFHHQVQNLFTFCRRLPVTLLADDVGLGKTISAGLILSELMARKRVSRALVLCPKILCPQWVEELEAKFGISGVVAAGELLDEELEGRSPVVVTTYESASDRLASLKPGTFDMLVLDEAHKLRNLHGGNNPPRMATSVRDALQRRLFKFVVMLTATPIQNRIWDLYSLIDCLTVAKGHKNPLGTPEQFRRLYLMPGSDGRRLHQPNAEAFRRILRQYVVRTRRGDARLQFPTREVRLMQVDLSLPEKDLTRLMAIHIGGLNGLQQTSLAQAMMSSPQALAAQLENMSGRQPTLGAAARQARSLADACLEPAKLQQLLFLCDELKASRPRDWRVVVFTHRKETQAVIGQALARKGIATGFIRGGEARQNQSSIERLRAEPPGVHVLVSTDAGAEGVNLQAANVLVNYDLPWNPMVVEQRIGRLQRLASEHGHVLICNLVAAGSAEERVVARLMEKLQGIAQAIGDIESILESPEWDGDEGRFEDQIRDLVVKSLLGQDVERAARLAQESIERASQMIEEQRAEIDQTLGRLEELHHSGPRMPRLERLEPAIPARDFVLRARRAEGGVVVEKSPGVYEVRLPGRPHEVIAFDTRVVEALSSQAVFMGKVRLFEPGKAEFERLVQHWVDRCGHHIHDLRRQTEAEAELLARSWSEKLPGGGYLGCQIAGREAKFQGWTLVKVKASNGVDAYEKLISGKFHPQSHQAIRPPANPSNLVLEEARPSDILLDCSAPLAKAVEADRDVGEFCRFYEARHAEELAAASDDLRLRHKANEDFTPSVVADIVGVQGVRYDEVRLLVRFTVQGEGSYEAVLRAVPASGQVLEEPHRKQCEHSGLRVPFSFLEACQVTGKLVLKHLLGASEESGRRGLRDRLVACQVTGKMVLDDEVSSSAASGIVGLKSAFVACQQTGCQLLPSETGKSAVCGKVVSVNLLSSSEKPPHRLGLAGEFGICEVTGRRLLSDELGRSAASGKEVDCDLLLPSGHSGLLALAEELVTCQESGARLLPVETETCVLTGKRVDTRLLARSEVSGAWALAGLLARCAASGKLALPRELEECEATGSRVLPGELVVCAATGKRALRSQMVACQQTGEWALSSEAARSDYGGKVVRRSLLLRSERAPGRQGLADEFGVCEATGKRLLLDELGRSIVSGKLVDRELLRSSVRSGALALKEEMITCQESGAELLPEESGVCSITGMRTDHRLLSSSEVSGALGLTRLMRRCSVTDKLVCPAELEKCEITGAWVLPSEVATCSVTGKKARCSLLLRCEVTGCLHLSSESGKSAVSGKVARKDLFSPSDRPPHRLGLPDELATCEVTGRRLLIDELGRSVVSNRLVGRDLLHHSARSGDLALAEEMVTCQESGNQLLPAETGRCEVTRSTVDARLLSRSEVSGKVGLSRLLERCAVTGKGCLPSELATCEVTGSRVLPSELAACSATGKQVLKSRLVMCEKTRRPVLASEAGKSAMTGLVVRKNLLFPSEKPPHRRGLAEEMAVCQATSRRLLLDEMGVSAVSGKRVDRGLLVPSARSRAEALAAEMVTCEESGACLLPGEAARCSVTGKLVDARMLSISESSGRIALTRLTRRCAATGKLALADELERCGLTGDWVVPSELKTCAVTGKRGLCSKMARSDVSGKYVVPLKAVRSAASGKVGLPEEVVRCAWLEQPVLRAETKCCTLTGKRITASLLNEDDELTPLRNLLDGRAGDAADHLIPRIRQLDEPFFSGLKHVWVVRSPRGGKLAVCGEIHSWMGMKVRHAGFLLKTEEFEVTGKGVLGYEGKKGWELEDELDFA